MTPWLSRLVRRPLLAAPVALLVVGLAGAGAYAALDSTSTSSGTDASGSNGQAKDSHAIVVNHGDDRYRYAISLKVVKVSGDVVDPQNAAVAVGANCTDCTTVAISLQGVLVYGDPTVFAPENLALAYNENCTSCQTLAEAYQEIVPADGKVRISGAGRQEIAAVRHDLEMIRHDDLTLAEIDARVDADAARLLTVLRSDVVPVGHGAKATPDTTGPTAPGTTPATSVPDTTTSDGATSSPTPGTSTPAPSDTATPTPTDTSVSPG